MRRLVSVAYVASYALWRGLTCVPSAVVAAWPVGRLAIVAVLGRWSALEGSAGRAVARSSASVGGPRGTASERSATRAAVGMGGFDRRRYGAIFGVRKFDGVGDRVFGNVAPVHDMVDVKLNELTRMVL